MKLAKLLFITAVALALLMTYVNAIPGEEEEAHDEKELSTALDSASISTTDVPSSQSEEEPYSLGGLGRFLLAKNKTEHVKCNKNPKICLAKGSSGPNCCKKKCVDLETDRLNCGHCSKKCKYNETCCKGKCVNLATDKNHCGRCNNSCGSGDFCMYGLCNYAS